MNQDLPNFSILKMDTCNPANPKILKILIQTIAPLILKILIQTITPPGPQPGKR